MAFVFSTVELGRLPPEYLLPPLPTISASSVLASSKGATSMAMGTSDTAAGSLMSLLVPQAELAAAKLPRCG